MKAEPFFAMRVGAGGAICVKNVVPMKDRTEAHLKAKTGRAEGAVEGDE